MNKYSSKKFKHRDKKSQALMSISKKIKVTTIKMIRKNNQCFLIPLILAQMKLKKRLLIKILNLSM
jgi:hypothetical protein